MKIKKQNGQRHKLEQIVPIEHGVQILIYGLNLDNKIIYSYSSLPDFLYYDFLVRDGDWVNLGELRLPVVYFKKYLKKTKKTFTEYLL